MVREVMAYIREDACGDVLQSNCLVIILRTCDGQEDEDDVVDEERREDDEYRPVELLVTEDEGEQGHDGNHREIS